MCKIMEGSLVAETVKKRRGPNLGPGPKIWAQGPNFGPRGPNSGPWAQIWAQGPKSGGPRARAPSFPKGYFLETRVRILTTPTFKEKLSLQASRPFPEGAPRKVSMFKIYLAGRSSDMSVSCPETIFFSPKWRDSGCGFFKILTFQEHKVLACQEQLLACQDTSFLGSNMPWWLWKAASGGFIF